MLAPFSVRTHPVFRLITHAALLLAVVLFNPTSFHASADQWTNLRGTNTVSAELIGIWNGRAILKMDTGRQVAVRLEDLNAESRIRAQDMQEEIDRKLSERVTELDAIATEAAAPAPATLPIPEAAPGYVPPTDGADLQTWLNQVQAQAKAGHLRVYYDSLPKSQQAQAEELFKAALQKLDANHWELARSSLHRISNLIVNKQRWIFSHPKFEGLSDGQRESLIDLASAFQSWGTPEIASIEKLRSGTLSDSFVSLDEAVSPILNKIISQNSAIAFLVFPSYEVESGPEGKMIAKIELPFVGTLQSIPMVQVEGRWTEGISAEESQAKWDGYKKDLEAIAVGSVRLGTVEQNLLQNLSTLLGALETAPNRKAFHREIDNGASGLQTAINAWAGIQNQANGFDDPYSTEDAMQDAMQDGYGGAEGMQQVNEGMQQADEGM